MPRKSDRCVLPPVCKSQRQYFNVLPAGDEVRRSRLSEMQHQLLHQLAAFLVRSPGRRDGHHSFGAADSPPDSRARAEAAERCLVRVHAKQQAQDLDRLLHDRDQDRCCIRGRASSRGEATPREFCNGRLPWCRRDCCIPSMHAHSGLRPDTEAVHCGPVHTRAAHFGRVGGCAVETKAPQPYLSAQHGAASCASARLHHVPSRDHRRFRWLLVLRVRGQPVAEGRRGDRMRHPCSQRGDVLRVARHLALSSGSTRT
mmetsp:Transcript_16051/g.27360  ORF Transcript_16051/g.27360 Transcript_16051/m.27360 type:complete len:257 (-) Transcript_16051:3767-4537(-)